MIETQELSKYYEERPAFERLTLRVGQGEVFGLLGPLGSGRSTLLKVLAALLAPTAGQARVAGWSLAAEPAEVRARVGYLPGFFGAYEDMRVWEYLEFYGQAYRIAGTRLPGRVSELLALGGLESRRKDYIAALSAEQRQRLGLIKTLLHDPPVLLLDEPAMGLEPAARVRIRELLARLVRPGKTVLISTNLIMDLAGICDRIGVLHGGRLLLEGAAAEVLGRLAGERLIELEVRGAAEAVCAAAQAHPGVRQAVPNAGNVVFSLEDAADDPGRVIGELIGQGVPIAAWREHEIQPEGLLERVTAKRA